MVTARSGIRIALALALSVVAAGPAAETLDAQYFGRNKVQYRTFDFRVLRTTHFDVYFYPEEERAARDAAAMAERWYARLSTILQHEFETRQPIVLYGSHPAFQQTTTLSGSISPGTGGVTESAKQRVILPLTGSYQETDHVVGHELVHAFQYDISGLGRSAGAVGSGGQALGTAPLWFIEGMAEYLSIGPVDAHTAMWMRDAALTGRLPTFEQLTVDPQFFPYRWGHAFWAYVTGRWGDAAAGQILRLVGQGLPYQAAIQQVTGLPLEGIQAGWHESIRQTYLPLIARRPEAREVARPLITESRDGGETNVGPALSPDGRYVAFLSERGGFDVELFLADAQTGEVIRRLRRGSLFDPHFQALRYINSAGAWAPDSRRLAFSALRAGRDRLVVIDVRTADVLHEAAIPDVEEIANPSWMPDGRTVVFTGISGGESDLYAYDLDSRRTRRLTDDAWAELHPAVSPDGRTVAFVTDRGEGADLASLVYGDYRIALLDVETGAIRMVAGADRGANTNPAWSRGGEALFFISNRDGIPNVYRVDAAGGGVAQVTRLFGGVSGITDISPAVTVARDVDRLLFTAYEDNAYNIYALEGAALQGSAPGEVATAGGVPVPAILPPVPRPADPSFNRVAAVLDAPEYGLPDAADVGGWRVVPASAALSLDYLGQPQVGYSTGAVAGQGGLYGGITALFSDILGYHTVATTVQATGGAVEETGFSVLYLNQKQRFNYGAAAQRVPYIAVGRNIELDTGGPGTEDDLVRNQIVRFRTFYTQIQAISQYPFSVSQRVELTAGYRRIAQDLQIFETFGPPVVQDGEVVGYQRIGQQQYNRDGEAFNLFDASAALVYDNSLAGYTSPFAGQRYRFEVSPTFGDLTFTQALADYRRYVWLRPVSVAVQALHFGRYGGDAEDRFSPVFLGQPSLVRGYGDVYGACRRNPDECDGGVVDLLFGSRIGVVKAELRLPVLRVLQAGRVAFPPFEVYGFFDAGVAWEKGTTPVLQRGPRLDPAERGIVTSTGLGARVNLFGFAIAQVDFVNALELDEGWQWQFALQPGF